MSNEIRIDGNLIFKYLKDQNIIVVESEGDGVCHNISGNEIIDLKDFMEDIKPEHEQEEPSIRSGKHWERLLNGVLEKEAKPEHKPLKDGEPCSHKGCLLHRSHPCEGCGRIAGKNPEHKPCPRCEHLQNKIIMALESLSLEQALFILNKIQED